LGFDFQMKFLLQVLSVLLFAFSASAAEVRLDAANLRKLLNNTTLTATVSGRAVEQVFQGSGSTFTIDVATKALSQGFWRLEGNKYCSQWPPSEYWSCFDVFGGEHGVVFVSSNGTRYQMQLPPAD
jgi:hypothetical protein